MAKSVLICSCKTLIWTSYLAWMSYLYATQGTLNQIIPIEPRELDHTLPPRPSPKLNEAVAWLRRYLAQGPRPSKKVIEAGAGQGIRRYCLYRAYPLVGVIIDAGVWRLDSHDQRGAG